MSELKCPLSNLSALQRHLTLCPACRSARRQLVDFAIEILLSESDGFRGPHSASNIVIINHQAGPATAPTTLSPLFSEFVKTRFEPDIMRHLKPSGRKNYGYLLNRHILPVVGDLRLSEVTYEMVQEGMVQKMIDAGYAVQTLRHVRQVTGSIFKHAMRTKHFTGTPPTFGVRLPELVRQPKHALTIPQARAVLQAFKGKYRAMALVSMTTSLSLAEMCALRWKRINLSEDPMLSEGEIIPPYSAAVRENFYQGSFGTPKTANRRRCVALPQAAVLELQNLQKTTKFPGADDLVFATRNGTAPLGSNLRWRVIKPVGNSIGLPWLNWHCFRNTYATLGEQLGLALSDRQAQMGHGNVWMTMEYTVSNIETRRAGAELIAKQIA